MSWIYENMHPYQNAPNVRQATGYGTAYRSDLQKP